jgi:hypothetical protein
MSISTWELPVSYSFASILCSDESDAGMSTALTPTKRSFAETISIRDYSVFD